MLYENIKCGCINEVVVTISKYFDVRKVFSVALLKYISPNILINIHYGDENQPIASKYNKRTFILGDPMSVKSFKTLWYEIGPNLFDDKSTEAFYNKFGHLIDKAPYNKSLSMIIESMNASWKDNDYVHTYEHFIQAVNLAEIILRNMFRHIDANCEADAFIEASYDETKEIYKDSSICILNKQVTTVHYLRVLLNTDCQYVLTKQDGFVICHCLPQTIRKFSRKWAEKYQEIVIYHSSVEIHVNSNIETTIKLIKELQEEYCEQ